MGVATALGVVSVGMPSMPWAAGGEAMTSRAHLPSQKDAAQSVVEGQTPARGAEQPYGNQAAAEDFGLAVRHYLESQGIPPAQLDEEGLPAWLSEDEELPEPERMHFGEPMLLAATTLPHFLVALVDGLGASLDGDTLDAVHQKLAEGSLVAATVGMPWYLVGIVEGVAREVRDLVMLPVELPDLLLATEELIDLLSGPAGSEVARALGLDLADAVAGEAQDLLELGPFDTARWLGLRVAPLLSDTILCLLTAGAATLAVRTVRLAARYLPDLKVLSRLARSIESAELPGGAAGDIARITSNLDETGKLPSDYSRRGYVQGGKVFKDRAGALPEPVGKWREADVGDIRVGPGETRGSQRVVYDEAGDVFYTPDHYETWIPIRMDSQ